MAWKSWLGIQVDRALDAHVGQATPGDPYFTVVGGICLITGMVGYVSAKSAGAPTTCNFVLNPDAVAGLNTILSTGTDIDTSVAGSLLTWNGLAAGTFVTLNASVVPMFTCKGIVVAEGVIGFVSSAASGTTRWTLWYIPIEAGAYITVVP
jgi:hypothetical protein